MSPLLAHKFELNPVLAIKCPKLCEHYKIYKYIPSFRDRDRDKRRDKDSTSSSKSHSKTNTEGGVLSSVLNSDRDIKIDKDKEQAKLEDEMQKRRERIEQWRAEKKKREIDSLKADMKAEISIAKKELQSKAWNLEDDTDEEEDENNGKNCQHFRI